MFTIDFGLALRDLVEIKAPARYMGFLTAQDRSSGSNCESSTIWYRRPFGVAITARLAMVVRVTEGHYNQANGIDVSRSMRELTLCDRWILYSGEVAC